MDFVSFCQIDRRQSPLADSVTESIARRQPMTMRPQCAPSGSVPSLAFRDIIDRELDFVWNCLHRFGIPEQDLESEASEVFSRVKNALPAFDASRRLHPWLAGFAYRVAHDYCRRRQARQNLEARVTDPTVISVTATTAGEAEEPPAPADEHTDPDECTIFRAALRELDLQRRVMFVLHIIYGYPISEIAESCEMPLEVAQSSLWLACSELVQSLKRRGWKAVR
jgi:RNA polymerase sigma-70 factor (ECF subfamily)